MKCPCIKKHKEIKTTATLVDHMQSISFSDTNTTRKKNEKEKK